MPRKSPKPPRKLTPRQSRFLEFYLLTSNATEAAMQAGYSKKNSATIGSQLLRHPVIAAKLRGALDKAAKTIDVTAAAVVGEMGRVGFSDPADLFDTDGNLLPVRDMPEDVRRAISGIKHKDGEIVSVQFGSKTQSLESLGKMLGIFDHEEPGQDVTPIRIIVVDEARREQQQVEVKPVPQQQSAATPAA